VANGIDLHVDSEPAGSYTTKIAQDNYDLAAGASFHADPDILRASYSPDIRSTLSGNKVVDEEIIAWLGHAAREPDGPVRIDLYRKAQRKIIEQSYGIPIYVLLYNLAAASGVKGITIDAHGFPEFHGAWLNG
jgi:peptide/nickel transport system substrate-binding protein